MRERGCELRYRNGLALDSQRFAVPRELVGYRGKPAGLGYAVIIGERHNLAASRSPSLVPRYGRSPVLDTDRPADPAPTGHLLKRRPGVVGRPVVHDGDAVALRRIVLSRQSLDAPLQQTGAVKGRMTTSMNGRFMFQPLPFCETTAKGGRGPLRVSARLRDRALRETLCSLRAWRAWGLF